MIKTSTLPIKLNLSFFDAGGAAGATTTQSTAAAQTDVKNASSTSETVGSNTNPTGTEKTQTGTDQKSQNADTANTTNTERTFTQAELDFIIGERLKRVKDNTPSEDEMKAFKEWQASQLTETERTATVLAQAQAETARIKEELLSLQQLENVRRQGITEDFVGYVHYEARKQATTKNITFDESLMDFIAMSDGKYNKPLQTATQQATTTTRQVTVDTGGHSSEVNEGQNYVALLEAARKANNTQEAVRLKTEAAQKGIYLI